MSDVFTAPDSIAARRLTRFDTPPPPFDDLQVSNRIRALTCLLILSFLLVGVGVTAQNAQPPAVSVPADLPDWAYTPPPPGSPPAPSALPADDDAVIRIPGTDRTMTREALRGRREIPDWYPADRRGEMPGIVRSGREGVLACGLCHLADGAGRPENAPVNGLRVEYFVQQMEDFKNGLRRSADPRKRNTNLMIGYAKAATAEEIRAAAEYFAAQPYPKRITVIESRTAPKVRLQGGMHMAIPAGEGGGMVPIGDEIVEVPDDNLRAEARDTRLGFTAYVPVGTLSRGKQLATKYRCGVCHGSNLEGLGPVPPLAGRSPSYAMRQLFDMKSGVRRGPWSELMMPLLKGMSVQDLMAVAAYAASLHPSPGSGSTGR
jgi:cytochrome c553